MEKWLWNIITEINNKLNIKKILNYEYICNYYNYSNIDNAYKPIITLSNISSKYVTITNTTTNKEAFTINNLTNSDVIYIDNMMGTITDSNNNNRLVDSNRSWVELCRGTNNFSVNGVCSINIEAYYPIMV